MSKKPTIYAFIDASNVIYGVSKREGWKVDLKKLREYPARRYQVKKAFYTQDSSKIIKNRQDFTKNSNHSDTNSCLNQSRISGNSTARL